MWRRTALKHGEKQAVAALDEGALAKRGRPRNPVRDLDPLVVNPAEACRILNCGIDKLYQLIHSDEIQSYLDGGSRKIVYASIKKRHAKLLAAQKDDFTRAHWTNAITERRRKATP